MEELAAYAAAFDRASRAQADPFGTMQVLNLSGIVEARDRLLCHPKLTYHVRHPLPAG